MVEFRFKVEIPEFFDSYELVGYWNEEKEYGIVSLYDEISRIFSLNSKEFEEFAKIFSKIKAKMRENPLEFAYTASEYFYESKLLAKRMFLEKEA